MPTPRTDPDASYVLNLCDTFLSRPSFRQYRFPFLFDKGHTLPVDAYYPDLNLVVEYRGDDDGRLENHKRDTLLEHGVSLVVLRADDFPRDPGGRLRRLPEPIRVVLGSRLALFTPAAPALLRHRGVDARPGSRLRTNLEASSQALDALPHLFKP